MYHEFSLALLLSILFVNSANAEATHNYFKKNMLSSWVFLSKALAVPYSRSEEAWSQRTSNSKRLALPPIIRVGWLSIDITYKGITAAISYTF